MRSEKKLSPPLHDLNDFSKKVSSFMEFRPIVQRDFFGPEEEKLTSQAEVLIMYKFNLVEWSFWHFAFYVGMRHPTRNC